MGQAKRGAQILSLKAHMGKDIDTLHVVARRITYSHLQYRKMVFEGWRLQESCAVCGKPFNKEGDTIYALEYQDDKPPEHHLFPQMWWQIIHEGCLK